MNKHHHDVRFTHPLSHHESQALEAEGKPVPPDWSASITSAAQAVRALEDSLPGNNQERTVAGLIALEKATADLRAFLTFRKAV